LVLQSGEDLHFTDDLMVPIVKPICAQSPDCAITLSLGERGMDSFKRSFKAGANRHLLGHKTVNEWHYSMLHPVAMKLSERKQCLFDLRDFGFQVGAGFMAGYPFQTLDHLYDDLEFLDELRPHIIGIGPFLPQADTPFNKSPKLLSIIRILFPNVLPPSTTGLGTLLPDGRELKLTAEPNVTMPNLTPRRHRKRDALYHDRICTSDDAAKCRVCLARKTIARGFQPSLS
jgi:biotin synthase